VPRPGQADLQALLGKMEDPVLLDLNIHRAALGQEDPRLIGPLVLGLDHPSLIVDLFLVDQGLRDRWCQEAAERCTTFLLTA